MAYWSWWVTALALSGLTLGFWWALQRPLGVSGSWARVVLRSNDKILNQAEAGFRNNPQLFNDALMRATVEEFGEEAVQALLTKRAGQAGSGAVIAGSALPVRTPWTAHFTFLAMLVAGGAIAAADSGRLGLHFSMGEVYRQLFGQGVAAWLTLFVGGVLVGFGTQMAGGCTSGHALSGAPRLVPASLLATAVFFTTAVVVSIVISFAATAGGVS